MLEDIAKENVEEVPRLVRHILCFAILIGVDTRDKENHKHQ